MIRLYVWEGVLKRYGTGIAFALADTEDEARRLILAPLIAERVELFGHDHDEEFPYEHGLDKPADHVHDVTDKVAYSLKGSE